MSTELATMDQLTEMMASGDIDYDMLAQLTGQAANDGPSFRSSFANASFNWDNVCEVREDDKPVEYEVPANSVKINHPDQNYVFLDKDVELVVLARYFMYRRWNSDDNRYDAQSEMHPEFRKIDMLSTDGTLNCGRSSSYVDEDTYNAMPKDAQELQKSSKLTRVVFAAIKGKGKTLKGEKFETEGYVPVRFNMSRSLQETIEGLLNQYSASRTLTFQHPVSVSIKRGKAGSFTIAVPTFTIDRKTSVDLQQVGEFLKSMKSDVTSWNQYVQEQYNKARKEDNTDADDGFIDHSNDDLDDEVPF